MPLKNKPYKKAPSWRRMAAMFYDLLILLALSVMVGFINLGIQIKWLGLSKLQSIIEEGYTLDNYFFYAMLLAIYYLFFSWFWIKQGQTLGMKAWHLKVLQRNYETITLRQSTIRLLIAIPSVFFFFLGMLPIFFRSDKKSIQDILSTTEVYYVDPQSLKFKS